MKFLHSLAFAGVALAQRAVIGLPKTGQTVARGDELIVQVQLPATASEYYEVAVAIGISDCTYGCYDASEQLGSIVYNGPFDPVYHETYLPPYQNFTVTVPTWLSAGTGQFNVAHFSLVGVSITT
ncbi:hypothetical protein N7445_004921 [Penicillium cf. griseofulvum]|nr:hypothetical protein N7445_004921 [Penicillium cf. griseofulvum]